MRAAVWGKKRMGIGRDPSRDTLRFLGMTLALSWGMWVPLAVLRLGGTSGGMSGGSVVLLAFPGVLVPGVVAVVLVARAGGRKAVRTLFARMLVWRVGVLPWAAVVVQPVLLLLAVGMTGAVGIDPPGVTDGARQFTSLLTVSVFLLVATMGEELGWRGLALPSLQRHRSPLVASIILGVAVAVWHLPYWILQGVWEDFGAGYLVLDLLFVMALTFQLTWVFNRSSGSLLLPMAFHLVFNLVNVAVVPVTSSTPAFAVLTALEVALALTVLRPHAAGEGDLLATGSGSGELPAGWPGQARRQ